MRKFARYAFSSPPLLWGPSSFALEALINVHVTAFPLNETKKTYFREKAVQTHMRERERERERESIPTSLYATFATG